MNFNKNVAIWKNIWEKKKKIKSICAEIWNLSSYIFYWNNDSKHTALNIFLMLLYNKIHQ